MILDYLFVDRDLMSVFLISRVVEVDSPPIFSSTAVLAEDSNFIFSHRSSLLSLCVFLMNQLPITDSIHEWYNEYVQFLKVERKMLRSPFRVPLVDFNCTIGIVFIT